MAGRSIKPNKGLDYANIRGFDLGAPALASTNRLVTTVAMGNKTYTLANAASADGLPRNVTVTGTQAGSADDTFGTITFTGTDARGAVITEVLVPVNGSTVAGVKAFQTVTSIVQAGWTAASTADNVVMGFGTLVGLPAAALTDPIIPAVPYLVLLGGAVVAITAAYSATAISGNTVDASAGTYNGTKHLVALFLR